MMEAKSHGWETKFEPMKTESEQAQQKDILDTILAMIIAHFIAGAKASKPQNHGFVVENAETTVSLLQEQLHPPDTH